MVPEIIIPSADANAPLSRVYVKTSVLLPESFRGGCSFGLNDIEIANVSRCFVSETYLILAVKSSRISILRRRVSILILRHTSMSEIHIFVMT